METVINFKTAKALIRTRNNPVKSLKENTVIIRAINPAKLLGHHKENGCVYRKLYPS
jgi:hypothetical protein